MMKLATFALVSTLTLTAAAQQDIQQRKVDQQDRIANGVRSGELTPRETSHLEHQEAAINHEEHAMRQADNGHLTHADRSALKSQQNAESRRIYRDKHNAHVR
ncbi:hypothetical protein [Terriglobus sp. TAA 43]|uniref:hypothetical protein n=1 Tax=Terriglobus sp. TAA 43 TaxID=278961 RepID=UPI001E32F244|nr:hypothetical protein [Terriglobus sp. TAA 43]